MDDIFSWIVTLVGCFGFWLGGKKIWWSWYVNIANQLAWVVFAVVTGYYAFLIGTAFYTTVFVRNAYLWTKEHLDKTPPEEKLLSDFRALPLPYINLSTCGNRCQLPGQKEWMCVRLMDHEGKHGYAGIFWEDEQGKPLSEPRFPFNI